MFLLVNTWKFNKWSEIYFYFNLYVDLYLLPFNLWKKSCYDVSFSISRSGLYVETMVWFAFGEKVKTLRNLLLVMKF